MVFSSNDYLLNLNLIGLRFLKKVRLCTLLSVKIERPLAKKSKVNLILGTDLQSLFHYVKRLMYIVRIMILASTI